MAACWRGCPGVLWPAARGALYGFGCGLPLASRPGRLPVALPVSARRSRCAGQLARWRLKGGVSLSETQSRPPFSPDAVVDDFAALLKSYRVSRVTGDRYAGEFPRELFRKHGIAYELAKQTKSELFRDLLPLLNSGASSCRAMIAF